MEPPPPDYEPPPPSVWLDPTSPRVALRQAAALVLVVACTAGFAIGFRAAATLVYERLYGAEDIVSAFEKLSPVLRFLTVTAGAGLAGVVGVLLTKPGGGQGVGGVMEVVALGTGRVSMRASLQKAAGCWIGIVTGSSVGREGPIIQFGGAMAGAIATWGGLSSNRTRVLVAAGTAAGFTAAYNTPFAAVLFVLEIVTGVITVDVVLATVLAAALSTAITRAAVGGGPIYGQRAFTLGTDRELLAYALLGVLAGLAGAAFSALLATGERAFTRLPVRQPFTAAIGGALVGAIALWLPQVAGNGFEVVNRILDGHVGITMMIVLFGIKALATSISVGSGTPGGAFTPSLFLGAALGGTFGELLARVAPTGIGAPGAYALVGMAALCAATTHAPLMAAVLVFELSGDYSVVLPLLIATGIATVVSRRARPMSVYMDELARRGIGWDMTWNGRQIR